jgi:hypothetical protein
MINYGVSDFVGILITIALYFYMTNLLWWGLFQVMEQFFLDDKEHENIFHHHYHYKAGKP